VKPRPDETPEPKAKLSLDWVLLIIALALFWAAVGIAVWAFVPEAA